MAEASSNPTGRPRMTRSEAARHAARVRYGKEQALGPATGGMSNPKIRARVAEILAEKANKGKKKAKGGGGKGKGKAAKPKLTDEQKQAEKDKKKAEADKVKAAERGKNMTKVGEDTGLDDHLANLDKFKQGRGLKDNDAAELEKQGLVERGKDGTPRMTGAGNALLSAAARGDSEGAKEAASRGRDAAAGKQERAGKQAEAEQKKAERTKQAASKQKQAAAQRAKVKQAADKAKAEKAGAKEASDKEKAAAPAKKLADNRAKVAKDMAEQDAGLAPAGAQALGDFADGKPLKPETAQAFEDMGLTEKGDDGKPRLTAEGRAAATAMDKGDTRAALDAISRAGEKKRNAKAGKAFDGYAIKQTAQERAMFASMGESGKLNPQNSKGNRPAPRRKSRSTTKKPSVSRKIKNEIARLNAHKKYILDAPHRARDPMHQASLRRIESQLAALNAKKALDMDDDNEFVFSIKAGARHSRTDMDHLQAIHDSSVACGASCATESDDSPESDTQIGDEASKAVKAMYDDPTAYAAHECNDIVAAASALQSMAMILMSELGEDNDEEDTIPGLLKAAHLLVDYIDTELDSIEEADAAEDEDEGAGDTVGHEPMKAIDVRPDVNPKAGIAEYGKVDFADAKNKKYPIDTEAHVRAAWNYIAKDENAAKYDPDEVTQIKAKIVAAWKKLIDKSGPPAAGKALDMLHVAGGAIKALDSDTIGGYAVLFGSADAPDIERDYYTKSTDFWLDHFGWPRPITYHHGMDAATKAAPVIGHWTKATIDDTGVWLEGQLDRAHAYYAAIKQLAERGYLKLSSDSAPQWVVREKQPNGANHVKRWPLVTASTTVTPMEPRMMPVEVKALLSEIGLEGIDDSQEAVNPDAALDAAKAADDERARVLLLELDLLQLELESA